MNTLLLVVLSAIVPRLAYAGNVYYRDPCFGKFATTAPYQHRKLSLSSEIAS
ncbi:MAG: hypothetical protein LBJ95_01785 [Oscillospiraceae bacterium]|nr:hypothetical protein [Oscillospiraceae bacterium]